MLNIVFRKRLSTSVQTGKSGASKAQYGQALMIIDSVSGVIPKDKLNGVVDMIKGYFDQNPEEDKAIVIIKKNSMTRTKAQGDLYRVWLRILANEEGYDEDELHVLIKDEFLPMVSVVNKRTGRIVQERKSTTKLKVGEFSEFLNKLDRLAARFYNVTLPRPRELYYKAMAISND